MSDYAACGSCRRHVRVGEARCPFCGAVGASAPTATTVAVRMSRAGLIALATSIGVAAAMSGCGSSQSQTQPPKGGPDEDAGTAADAANAAPTEQPPVAMYGGPPPPVQAP